MKNHSPVRPVELWFCVMLGRLLFTYQHQPLHQQHRKRQSFRSNR